jgi:hypothetical protein
VFFAPRGARAENAVVEWPFFFYIEGMKPNDRPCFADAGALARRPAGLGGAGETILLPCAFY